MKRTNNIVDNPLSKQVEKRLVELGFFRLQYYHEVIDNVGALIIKIIPLSIILIRLCYVLYYYPRSVKYLLSHPISEVGYLLVSLEMYFKIAFAIVVIVGAGSLIIMKLLSIKAAKIQDRVHTELDANQLNES